MGFSGGSNGKESTFNAGQLGSSLDWEDSLEKGMTTHSSILAWKISWTEAPGGLQSMILQRVGQDRATDTQRSSQAYPSSNPRANLNW